MTNSINNVGIFDRFIEEWEKYQKLKKELLKFGTEDKLYHGQYSSLIVASQTFKGEEEQGLFLRDNDPYVDFIIHAKDKRIKAGIEAAHMLRDKYLYDASLTEEQREAIISQTLQQVMMDQFGKYNPSMEKDLNLEEETNKKLLDHKILKDEWKEKIDEIKKTTTPYSSVVTGYNTIIPQRIEDLKTDRLICVQRAYIMGAWLAEAGIPNHVVQGAATFPDSMAIGHAYAVSDATGAVFEASTNDVPIVYNINQQGPNGAAVNALKAGETLIVQGRDQEFLAYGTGKSSSEIYDREAITKYDRETIAIYNVPRSFTWPEDADPDIINAVRAKFSSGKEKQNLHPADTQNKEQQTPPVDPQIEQKLVQARETTYSAPLQITATIPEKNPRVL